MYLNPGLNALRTKATPRRDIGLQILGCASIICGSIAAIASVPNDLSSSDALFSSGLFMTIGLVVPVVLQVRRHLGSVLRVDNMLMLGIVYWLLVDLLQSAYAFEDVNPEHVQTAFIALGGFAIAVQAGASGTGWQLPKIVKSTVLQSMSVRVLHGASLVVFVLGMSNFVIASGFDPVVLITGLGADRWNSPWGRGELGGANAFLDHMQYFGYILPSLTVLIAKRAGWFSTKAFSAIVTSSVMIAFLSQSGGRRIIGVVIGAAIITWILSQRRLSPKMVFGFAASVLLLLMFMQEMLRYRNFGFGVLWAGERPELAVRGFHVDDNMLRLAQLIRFFPETADYVYYGPVYHALCLPIPRLFWPGKPLGPGFDLPALVGMTGVSLSSSIIGELYVSFGLWAVLAGGFVMGRLAGMWNKILSLPTGPGSVLMYPFGLMAMFTGMRSMQALVQMSYIVLAWIVVSKFLSSSQASTKAVGPSSLALTAPRSQDKVW